jgi:hypothetical protein
VGDYFEGDGGLMVRYVVFLDFKLSPFSVLTVSTFGCFPGVWFILTDVSEPSFRSIFKGLKCVADTVNTEHGESLKSRIIHLYGEETATLIRRLENLHTSSL